MCLLERLPQISLPDQEGPQLCKEINQLSFLIKNKNALPLICFIKMICMNQFSYIGFTPHINGVDWGSVIKFRT